MATRREFLGLLGVGGIASIVGIDAFLLEPKDVEITRHRVGATGRGSASGLRVVQLSDLHLQEIGGYESTVARKVGALEPDLIVITGDALDRADRLPVLEEFLDLLDPGVPRYAVPGNWEYAAGLEPGRLARRLEARGCRLLVNESVVHESGGRALRITGLDDLVGGRPDPAAALRGADRDPDHLLLVHCPVYRDVLGSALRPEARPDLVLSGHTHGGQITLFGWAPVLPRGSGPYVCGWYRDAAPPLYVSRGVGTTFLPARFCAPPEIAVFDWARA